MGDVIWTGRARNGLVSDANNFSPAAPTDGDVLYLIDNAEDILGGDLSAVLLNEIVVDRTYTGLMRNYLALNTRACRIGTYLGKGEPASSPRIMLDFGNVSLTGGRSISVLATAAAGVGDDPPVLLLADDADTDLKVEDGIVGVGVLVPGETAEFGDVDLGDISGLKTPASTMGPGVVAANLRTFSGQHTYRGDFNAGACYGGTFILDSALSMPSFDTYGGIAYLDRFVQIDTLRIWGGLTDLTRTNHARTIDQPLQIAPGGRIRLNPDHVTMTNNIADMVGRLQFRKLAS